MSDNQHTRPSEAEIAEALRPFAHFWRQWSLMPMRSMDDVIYAIHTGSQYEAEIRRSDCERASEVLEALSTPPAAIDSAMEADRAD